jgi:hypothetical protein
VLDYIPTYTIILVIVCEHNGNVLLECKDQKYFLGAAGGAGSGKRGAGSGEREAGSGERVGSRCVRRTTLPPSCVDFLEVWESQCTRENRAKKAVLMFGEGKYETVHRIERV